MNTLGFGINNKIDENNSEIDNIDEIFEIIGELGKYQMLIIVLVGLIASSAAISSYLTIFTDATPEFRLIFE